MADLSLKYLLYGEDKSASKAIKGVGDSANKSSNALSQGFKLAAAGAALAVAKFAADSIAAASDVSESTSKVGVVFGSQAGQILKASETSAKAMGMSKGAYLEAAGGLGNLLVSLKIAPKTAAGMSQSMVKLAGDMASFNNVPVADALAAIQSGLTGETEPLKRFGVNMNEATIKATAMAMGLIKPVKDGPKIQAALLKVSIAQDNYGKAIHKFGKNSIEAKKAQAGLIGAQDRLAKATEGALPPLTAQQKALAAQKLILNQTKTASGDFARTSTGLANQQKIATARFEDLQATIGKKLLPVMNKAMDMGLKTADWISKNSKVVVILVGVLGTFAVAMGAATLATKVMTAATNLHVVAGKVAAGASKAWAGAQWLLNAALTANPIGLIVVGIAALIGIIVLVATKTTWFQTIWKNMTTGIGILWRALWNNVLQPVIKYILSGFATLSRTIGNVLVALGRIPGFGWAKTAGTAMLRAADQADRLARNIKKIPSNKKVTVSYFQITTSIKRSQDERLERTPGGRARGGPVMAGVPYIVGEHRPEVFVPNQNGKILPRVGDLGSGSSTGSSSGQPLVINQYLDGRLVHQSLLALKRTTGGGLGLERA